MRCGPRPALCLRMRHGLLRVEERRDFSCRLRRRALRRQCLDSLVPVATRRGLIGVTPLPLIPNNPTSARRVRDILTKILYP
ncbi:hypothetical protein C8J57DRAFT_1713672 [Mycena rebaudengoi]|nr:hypothetical protein C8J57DRAFT_1713672 [Mycena rebaudengoi]